MNNDRNNIGVSFNTKYEIYSPSGSVDFKGVQKNGKQQTIKIIFDDDTHVVATKNHTFVKNNQNILVKDLIVRVS